MTHTFLFFLALVGAGPALAAPAQQDGATLRLGVMAEEPAEPDRIILAYDELISVLRKGLGPSGIDVPQIVIAADLEEMSQRLREGEVDMVIETVFASRLLRDRSGNLEPGLALVRQGLREYRSVFFTLKDSPVRELGDLRGRTLVLEAPRSTSAFALPRAELARMRIPISPDDVNQPREGEVRCVLAGDEINQAFWVVRGRGDAGAFNDGDWESLPARIRDELRIFHRTDSILRGLLSFRSDMDPRVRRRAEEFLLGLHQDSAGQAALARARINRFERLDDDDRQRLGAWEEALGAVAFNP